VTAAADAPRRIGIDTGGTFTDCVLVDAETHELTIAKVPSQPSRPQEAIAGGIDRLLAGAVGARAIESVVHGTTIATNAVITGDLARIGVLTTRGFRDVLEIGTQMRPSLYDLHHVAKPVIASRDLRLEVAGRLAANGTELEPIDPGEVERAARQLAAAGVEAIVVACLFSFRNPEHESRIQALASGVASSTYVIRSSAVSPEPREYPRFATAAINAGLAPRIDPYISALDRRVRERYGGVPLYVMQSNGGIATAGRSGSENVHQLILSGPAAGVIGSAREAERAGFSNCVTFDVGGTSADVGLVRDGSPGTAVEMTLPNGVPCKLPHLEVETIGAGGGSIAAVDSGGALTVGPDSAGAAPGPVCYGQGGTEPTVTDAHLVLGRLSPAGLIGGELTLDRELARASLAGLGDRLGTSAEHAALGVIAILEQNMIGAIRRAAARRGEDLREYVLVAGGGAGPLHAARIVRTLEMRAAVIPSYPGLVSALGLLDAPIRHDLVEPLPELVGDDRSYTAAFERLERRAVTLLDGDRVAEHEQQLDRFLDIRYVGQEYAVTVPVAGELDTADVVGAFHRQHERTYGHCAPEAATEIVAARMVALGLRRMPELRRALPAVDGEPVGSRLVHFDLDGARETLVYSRESLASGQAIAGPAIVEQLDTTTVIPPGSRARVNHSAALVIETEPA
jgi:N-methylhydantoinase A